MRWTMFGKVFESMFTGSLFGSGPTTFAVWTYAIVNARPPGEVELNPKLLAATLGCSEADVLEALETLCAPDPNSRSADEDGRRLVQEANFLYRIPTWDHYQRVRDHEARKAKWREDKRRQRSDKNGQVSGQPHRERDRDRDPEPEMDGSIDGVCAAGQKGEGVTPVDAGGVP